MISNGSQLQVTDNSGAKVAQCINQSGRSWGIGDVITVSIKKAQPRSKVAAGQVRGWEGQSASDEMGQADEQKQQRNACNAFQVSQTGNSLYLPEKVYHS